MSSRRPCSDIGISAPPLSRAAGFARSKPPDKQPLTQAPDLEELSKALPGQIHAAARAVSLAERSLADILILRATGQLVQGSRISAARMALARSQRDADDLQRIHNVLPAMLDKT